MLFSEATKLVCECLLGSKCCWAADVRGKEGASFDHQKWVGWDLSGQKPHERAM